MTAPAQVTLIGGTVASVAQRAAVLQHFWLVETVTLELGEEPKQLTTHDEGLVASVFAEEFAAIYVVCSSIAEPERQTLIERIRQTRPDATVVRIDRFDSGPLAGADATVNDDHGPAALVSTIYELLMERGLPGRPWPAQEDTAWVQ